MAVTENDKLTRNICYTKKLFKAICLKVGNEHMHGWEYNVKSYI